MENNIAIGKLRQHQMVTFFVMKLIYPDLNLRFDVGVIYL
jgi:hypothetical protein